MAKAKWKPKAISDEAKAWLAKPINQQLFWTKPQTRLEQFLKGDDILPGAVAFDLGQMSYRYHVERGQYSDDEVDYEYDSSLDRIHPAEILAFLRLRQKLGLAVPEIKHLILDNPLAKLHEPKPFPDDPFLNRVAEAADVLLRKQEGGGLASGVKRGTGGLFAFPINQIKKIFR